MASPSKDVVAITTVEEVDVLIERLMASITKLDAAQGSAVKTMKAEVETLSNIEAVSNAMKQFISRNKDRENLKAVFGGDASRLARARALIESVIGPPTKLSDKTADDKRPAECLTWCDLIQRFLQDKPFGGRFNDNESAHSETPAAGLTRSSSAPWAFSVSGASSPSRASVTRSSIARPSQVAVAQPVPSLVKGITASIEKTGDELAPSLSANVLEAEAAEVEEIPAVPSPRGAVSPREPEQVLPELQKVSVQQPEVEQKDVEPQDVLHQEVVHHQKMQQQQLQHQQLFLQQQQAQQAQQMQLQMQQQQSVQQVQPSPRMSPRSIEQPVFVPREFQEPQMRGQHWTERMMGSSGSRKSEMFDHSGVYGESMAIFDGVSSIQVEDEGQSVPDSLSARDNFLVSTTPHMAGYGMTHPTGVPWTGEGMPPEYFPANMYHGAVAQMPMWQPTGSVVATQWGMAAPMATYPDFGYATPCQHQSGSLHSGADGQLHRLPSGLIIPDRVRNTAGDTDRRSWPERAGRGPTRAQSFVTMPSHPGGLQKGAGACGSQIKGATAQTVKDYSKMISACGKRREWTGALDLLHKMMQRGLQPDVISFNATISACGKGGQWRCALALLQELRQSGLQHNAISCNAAIGACEKVGQWEQALALLHGMQQDFLQPDVISYNATISACGKGNQPRRALDLLSEMWQSGYEPDVISYNAAIGACEKGGQWEQALMLLREMRQWRRTPDVISYNTSISACGKGGQANRALVLLHEMRQHGLHPNVISYSAAISACEKGGLWERALQLLAEIREWGLYPNVISYSAAISACEKGSQWKYALDLFSEMWRCGLEPDVICYNATISACGKGGNWLRALDLLQDMWMRRMKPNVISYSAAISACEKGGQWECAVQLLCEMRQWGLQPNVISYSAAISACEKGGEWERALSLLHETRQRGLQPDIISYSAAISACEKGGQWERALELLDEMRNWGLRPNVISCSAAITACEKSGQWERALCLFQEMLRQGLQPDIVSYSVTISACEKGGQWEHTLELLHEMRQCAMQHPGNDANPAPGMTGCSPRRTPKQNQDFPPLYADPTVVQARGMPQRVLPGQSSRQGALYVAPRPRGTSSPRQDMISDPSVHWPHTSPRQRQRMGNASTPRRVDISGCDFPHGVEPGGKVQSGQPAQPGHSAQDSDGNSLVCVKNTFIDLAPQTPKTRGQRRSMPTLPAGIGVYYS